MPDLTDSSQSNQHFQKLIIDWFDKNGRKTLPWQQPATPYRVWISEIMLQQTQVDTVIPYFQKFIQQFPEVDVLANANTDKVMHLWSGLGYYARARNLHKSAKILQTKHQSKLPQSIEQLEALPGIGKSTAGAILSLGFKQPAAILDGNVKRVLTRHFSISGWPGKTSVIKQLWDLSEQLTPNQDCNKYNQAMMDIGATLCKRSKPLCPICPIQKNCSAKNTDSIKQFPEKKPSKIKPVKQQQFLIITNQQGHILLHQRPPTGIWGGLWCFPDSSQFNPNQFKTNSLKPLSKFTHQFSHYTLKAKLSKALLKPMDEVMDSANWSWYDPANPAEIGIPTPVSNFLRTQFPANR